MGFQLLIRDYPLARQTVWQFGYSLFWGVHSVNTVQSRTIRNKKCFFPFLLKSDLSCSLFLSSVRSSLETLHCFFYSSWTCAEALSVALRGAGDKEWSKKGHHTPSGAITRMTGRPSTPSRKPQSLLHWGWGISKGGAWEAITVIPSNSDHSCQLQSLSSRLFMIWYCSILHISLSSCSLICRATFSSIQHPLLLSYFKLHHRDQKTKRRLNAHQEVFI